MNKREASILVLCIFSVALYSQTIKDYYRIFPYKLKIEETVSSMDKGDTIVDNKNAYYHVQSLPNDCCSDYFTFTFFKTESGNKIFAFEKGAVTTASEDYATIFYSYADDKWVDITSTVFPFKLTFDDFYLGKTLPKKNLQQFKTHIILSETGTDIIVRIVEKDQYKWDELFPAQKDRDAYEKLFIKYKDSEEERCFYKFIYFWDKKEGTFKLKEKQIDY